MLIAATRDDCMRTRTTAARKRVRLRAKSPVACERATKVVMALSRPKTAILLTRSVFAQATENVPKAAGPSSRATRKVKTPRRFDANNAMVLKNAPRLSSNPVLSTGGAVSGIGAARSALSRVLTELLRCHSPANCLDMNALSEALCPSSCESGHQPWQSPYYMSSKAAPHFILAPKWARCNRGCTNVRAHIAPTLQSSAWAAKIFRNPDVASTVCSKPTTKICYIASPSTF